MLKRCMAPKEKGTKKFAPRWVGPYFIVDVLDDTTYRIAESLEGPHKVTHHDRLKPYHFDPEKVIDNSWVFGITKTKSEKGGVEIAVQTEGNPGGLPEELQCEEELAEVERNLLVVGDSSSSGTSTEEASSLVNDTQERKKVTVRSDFRDAAWFKNVERRGRPRRVTCYTVIKDSTEKSPRHSLEYDWRRSRRLRVNGNSLCYFVEPEI